MKTHKSARCFICVEILRKYKLMYRLRDKEFDHVMDCRFAKKNSKSTLGNMTSWLNLKSRQKKKRKQPKQPHAQPKQQNKSASKYSKNRLEAIQPVFF